MEMNVRTKGALLLLGLMLLLSDNILAQGERDTVMDIRTLLSEATFRPLPRHFAHRIGVDFRPSYVVPTNSFLEGDNYKGKRIDAAYSGHLKYSFQSYPNTIIDKLYGGAYQGVGVAYYAFGDRDQLGDPIAFYLFQGARLAQFNTRLSFNYEWNFGVSFGWQPYDFYENYDNVIIGSRINAYLNTNFYLSWMLSRGIDLTAGVDLTHFSNGNTKYPNAGLNTVGAKLGLVYHFNRESPSSVHPLYNSLLPVFPRHVSYDLVLFGAWRRKGVDDGGDTQILSPSAYTVMGFNFAPMYNFGYKFRAGVSLDGVYDGSANVYTEYGEFYKPSVNKQLALGLSGRAEFVMPYFTVNLGMGANVLHGGGDLKSFYQVLALKAEVTRSSFIHIGYSLKDLHEPNFLMLGIGYRFNNKYPTLYR